MSRVGYFGSLVTQSGIGALDPHRASAALGLFSLTDPGDFMRRYAPRVGCPAFFTQQLDDEIHPSDRVGALFDLLASPEKDLRSSPGAHIEVPSRYSRMPTISWRSISRLKPDAGLPVR